MRNYEILLVIHPDNQAEQITEMTDRYKTFIEERNGKIVKADDWGRRQLAYPIKKVYKGFYLLLQVTCDQKALKDIQEHLAFNDMILRSLITNVDKFKENGPKTIDYKNVEFLKRLITDTFAMKPKRLLDLSAKQQRLVTRAVKRARQIALVPYCDAHN